MNKKLISVIISAVMLIIPFQYANAEGTRTVIKIGDYLQMGTYDGEPILWRCVDIDRNDYLMLSDKILCLKPFDAHVTQSNEISSHSRGNRSSYCSNYWADSNIRSWLNSEESAGNVQWLCGNPPDSAHVFNKYNNAYDQEAGFLSNFTELEKKAIKETTQKSLLAECDKDIPDVSGTAKHIISNPISSVIQNYYSAYSEQVTDKMFLLDVQQINIVYDNGSLLGDTYYVGKPTENAVNKSDFKAENLSADKEWYTWLRSPNANSPNSVRYVTVGSIESTTAFYGDKGIRPAFYYNLSDVGIIGSGTLKDPYIPHEHSLVYHEAVAPTCTKSGNCEYWECENGCNRLYSDENGIYQLSDISIPPTGHTQDDGTVTKEATCTETGILTYKCTVCDEVLNTEEIPAAGHVPVTDSAYEPTCTDTGKTEGSHCCNCGEIIVAQEDIPAKGHDWDEWSVIKEPSDSEAGIKTRACKRCDETETAEIPVITCNINFDGENAVIFTLKGGMYAVIFAVYNSDDVLVKTELLNIELQEGENPPLTPSFDINETEYVKVMLWDTIDGMKPLCTAKDNANGTV